MVMVAKPEMTSVFGEGNRKPTRGHLLLKNWVKAKHARWITCASQVIGWSLQVIFFVLKKKCNGILSLRKPRQIVLKSGCKSAKIQKLVGGFNPFEKYAQVKMKPFPQGSGWKFQEIFELPPHLEKFQSQLKASGHIRRRRAEWRPRSMF